MQIWGGYNNQFNLFHRFYNESINLIYLPATAPPAPASSDLSGPTISNIIFGILALLVNLLVLLSTTSYKSWSLYANKHFSKVSPSEIVGCFIVSAFASLLQVILLLCPLSRATISSANSTNFSIRSIRFCSFIAIFSRFSAILSTITRMVMASNRRVVKRMAIMQKDLAHHHRNRIVKVLVLFGNVRNVCVQ